MKTLLLRIASLRQLIRFGFSAAVVALIVGCTTAVTSEKMTAISDDKKFVRGIPYYLPMASLTVTVQSIKDDKAKHKEFSIVSAAKLLPDPNQGFVLDSLSVATGRKLHEIKLKDGMLTLVSTEDESKVGEILTSLLSSAINVSGYGAISAGELQAAAARVPRDPTAEELAAIYSSMTAEPQVVGFSMADSMRKTLPGTGGLLQIAVLPNSERFGDTAIGGPVTGHTYDYSGGRLAGIYTRVLKPVAFDAQLEVPWENLFRWRVGTLKAKLAASEKTKTDLEEAKAENDKELLEVQHEKVALDTQLSGASPADKPAIQVKIDAVKAKIEALEKAIKAAPEAIAKVAAESAKIKAWQVENDAWLHDVDDFATYAHAKSEAEARLATVPSAVAEVNAAQQKLDELATRGMPLSPPHFIAAVTTATALVPDESFAVEVPITKAWMGISKNTVTLESGILTSYKTEKDSPLMACVRVLYDATGKLVELPTRLVQFKIDYSKKQKELLDAEKSLDTLKDEVAKLKAAPSDHQLEVDKLTKEKQVLGLEKEIADLKSQIAKLAAAR